MGKVLSLLTLKVTHTFYTSKIYEPNYHNFLLLYFSSYIWLIFYIKNILKCATKLMRWFNIYFFLFFSFSTPSVKIDKEKQLVILEKEHSVKNSS